ncbi:DUF3846 domain-containing protein [Dendrosporobacter sp. 1207_IL3150]|uniref:DUF3846 domain-containing protein n=1 Tax=Dendrosporobacter sp. 1207_IL3150 TaxID=3084054 RepID=UPI002FDABD70
MSTINAILIEPGKEPAICKLSANIEKQIEEISAILDGNFATTRLFNVGNGISLHIFVNDLAVPLGLAANRRFPKPDDNEIIFGNALFLALEDENGGEQGGLDIPEDICEFFIKSLNENLECCKGNEKPEPSAEIYTENPGTAEERSFKWQEIERPQNIAKIIGNGRVKIVDDGNCDTIEINGRYFKQVIVDKNKPLQ